MLGGRDSGGWASHGGFDANVAGSSKKTVVASSSEMKLWWWWMNSKRGLIKLIFYY